jgi:hypothetical protein
MIQTGSKSVEGRWGNKWVNMPHRFQPISADLDLAESA